MLQIGARTLWNPTKNLDVGAEIQWTEITKSTFSGGLVTFSPAGCAPATFVAGNAGVFSAIFRVQRNFYP
jgi:hypothetical protein